MQSATSVQAPIRLSLRRNFSWTLIGNVFYALSQWIMIMALAKLGTPELVGMQALALAISTPIILSSNLQLRAVQATDAQEEYTFADYLGLRLIMLMVAFVVVGIILLLGSYPTYVKGVILVYTVSKVFESISDIAYGLFQKEERMDYISQSMLWRGGISLLVFVPLLWMTEDLLISASGLAFVWLIILLMFDLRYIKKFVSTVRPSFQPGVLRALFICAFPMGVVMLLLSLNLNIPRYFIENQLGVRELGIFAALAYFMQVGGIVTTALGQSVTPRLSVYFSKGKKQAFVTLLLKLMGMGLLLGGASVLVAALIGEEVITFLYTPDYAAYNTLFVWMMVIATVNYIGGFLGVAVTAQRKFQPQVPVHTAKIVASVALCVLWIPIYGLVGAVWSLLATTLLSAVLYAGIVLFSFRQQWLST